MARLQEPLGTSIGRPLSVGFDFGKPDNIAIFNIPSRMPPPSKYLDGSAQIPSLTCLAYPAESGWVACTYEHMQRSLEQAHVT